MLSRLIRFALISVLFAASPAFAAGIPNSQGLPGPRDSAPAFQPVVNVQPAGRMSTRKGAVDQGPISPSSAPVQAATSFAPTAPNATFDPNRHLAEMGGGSDFIPLAVRPAFTPIKILYAPSYVDDPAFRAALAAITGGVVDYFDATSGTPTAVQLAGYNCVYTWAEFAFSDRVTFGNRLADFVDAGGKVILGSYCTYTTGFSMGGRIMTSGYSPVTSPSGTNHHSLSSYAGDGFRSMHAGVLAYAAQDRDVLVPLGVGIVNGHYADGEIAQAYRPDGKVIYSNGIAASGFGSGDWVKIIANAAMAKPSSPGMLMAPADADDPTYRGNISALTTGVVDYYDSRVGTASPALLHTYDCIYLWGDNVFADPTTFGNELADRVDQGARVILGIASTFAPYGVLGRIITPDYAPVINSGGIHFAAATYGGDGFSGLLSGVGPITSFYRDHLIGQGSGMVDGHYGDDGEVLGAFRPDGRVVYTNGTGGGVLAGGGNWPQLIANACLFTPTPGRRILYAPSDVDDPVLRAKIAECTGAVVDYFDASSGTPTALTLANYGAVYTWSNFGYADPFTFGDRLADFVDAGGKVVLGTFTTYSIFAMQGRIMTAPYCPVFNPTNSSRYSVSPYNGDGVTCFHHGVTAYTAKLRDFLALQGAGVAEGHYADGEIAVAYRPDRRVVYVNGLFLFGTGDLPRLIANAAQCDDTPGVLFASNNAGGLYTLNTKTGVGAFDLNLPPGGATDIEFMPNGHMWVQERDGVQSGQQVNPYTGAPLTPVFGTARIYNGLEYAIGRLWGAGIPPVVCNASTWAVLDPSTGLDVTTIGPTGQPPINGLAFDQKWSTMYGTTSGCAGNSNLVRIDVTTGVATVLGSTGVRLGSLQFGPEGDLYGGGDSGDGGHLYRINQTNGFTKLIGTTGMGNVTGLTLGVNGAVAVGPAPAALDFAAPYPNPSTSGIVQFRFSIPTPGDVQLELYDVAGRLRWSEAMNGLTAGPHSVTWNGLASNGARLASGIYHMRLVSAAGTRTVRLVRFE